MVLLARSLPLYTRPISSRALSTATAAARSISNVRVCLPARSGLTSRAALAAKSSPSYLLSNLRVPASTRLLTTKREKVKVLLVLYDGGKHAEEVSCFFLTIALHNSEKMMFCFCLGYSTPNLGLEASCLPSPPQRHLWPYASWRSNGRAQYPIG